MTTGDCVFCRIVRKEIPGAVRLETDDLLAFDSIDPKAPIHILVIPKHHIEHLGSAVDADQVLLGKLLLACRDLAKQLALPGFKIVINNGPASGQSVPHLHIHLLGGQISPSALQSL